jgi:hypothetical protein
MNQSNALYITKLSKYVIIPDEGLPAQGINLQQSKETLSSSGTMISQPLTQLIRIHSREPDRGGGARSFS